MEENEYEIFQEMFLTEGWKKVIEDLEQLRKINNDLQSAHTLEMLYKNKGKLEIIDILLSLETTAEMAKTEEGSNLQWWSDVSS
tara:strand:- start:2226 stop:2477 length:252 start_codon:yes stop_codon:yes gene_type:complete